MIEEINARATVLSVARAHKWVVEVGANRGQAVEAILKSVHLSPGNPWCAAFVSYIGNAVLGSDWPLPMVGGCATLGDAATHQGKLSAKPEFAAIFLIWHAHAQPAPRFGHTGFCLMPSNGGWLTIEGNASPDGSPEGTGVFERKRTFAPLDRFIHWWL